MLRLLALLLAVPLISLAVSQGVLNKFNSDWRAALEDEGDKIQTSTNPRLRIKNQMHIFSSANAYWKFAQRVKSFNRYIPDTETKEFFKALLEQAQNLKETLPGGSFLWRAQLGSNWQPYHQQDGQYVDDVPAPLDAARMVPRTKRALEGRANPKGIPCLYLATHKETALSEVRPWIGSLISVAQFKIARDLSVVNVTTDEKRKLYIGGIPEDQIDKAVLYEIDKAFSEPVTASDDSADYAPTQIIADLFRSNGFDGIGYRSSLGPGHNVALFDINAATPGSRFLFEVEKISFEFKRTA